jgi:hypothetical protein
MLFPKTFSSNKKGYLFHKSFFVDIPKKQLLLTDILVLIQETPFIDLQHKEINRLLKKDVFVAIIKKDILQGVYIFNS